MVSAAKPDTIRAWFKLILFGEAFLRLVATQFVEHYHLERAHQGQSNQLLSPPRCRQDHDLLAGSNVTNASTDSSSSINAPDEYFDPNGFTQGDNSFWQSRRSQRLRLWSGKCVCDDSVKPKRTYSFCYAPNIIQPLCTFSPTELCPYCKHTHHSDPGSLREALKILVQ